MRPHRLLPGLSALLLGAMPAWSQVAQVDRGLLAGSDGGRIWSRVVDEVGNAQGQAETWHLGPPPEGAMLTLTVDAPVVEDIDITLHFQGRDGLMGELKLTAEDRTPTGYADDWGPFWPPTNADLLVVLYPAKPSVDQHYRISAAWGAGAAAPAPAASPDISGRWSRSENGATVESIEILGSGAAVTLVFYDAAGAETQRLPATRDGDTITARGISRLVTIVLRDGVLAYTSTDFDGANRWDGVFTR